MNKYAKENDKVIFTGEHADYLEKDHAFKILEVGKEYTVYYTTPHEYTGGTVCLKEHTSYDFEMNMFEDSKKECNEEERIFNRAKKVNIKDYDGPLYDQNNDRYFEDIDDLEDYYASEDIELPKYVYGCHSIRFALNIADLAYDELENNHYEGAEADLSSLGEIQKMIDEWTEKQNITTYECDLWTAIIL